MNKKPTCYTFWPGYVNPNVIPFTFHFYWILIFIILKSIDIPSPIYWVCLTSVSDWVPNLNMTSQSLCTATEDKICIFWRYRNVCAYIPLIKKLQLDEIPNVFNCMLSNLVISYTDRSLAELCGSIVRSKYNVLRKIGIFFLWYSKIHDHLDIGN